MFYTRNSTPARRWRQKNSRGMTLLELIFIVAVMGILFIIGVPTLVREIQRMKVEQAVAQSMGFLQSARLRAVRDQGTYAVQFDVPENRIEGVSSGLPGDSDERQSLSFDDFGVELYLRSDSGDPCTFPTELCDATCGPPPVAGFSFESTGNAVGVPVEFCIADISGNVMRISVDSIGGQPRVRKFISKKDPHRRYDDDARDSDFYVQDWRWY